MKKKLGAICLAFLGVTAMQGVWAADTNNKSAIWKPEYVRDRQNERNKIAQEKKIREDVQEELYLEEGRNQVFRLDTDIGDVFITDPQVADIQTLNSKSFYIRGKAPGVTYLKFYDRESGDVLGNYIVRVTYKLDEIKKAISEVFPDLVLDFVSINDQLMVKGEVPSPEMAREVMDVIGRFVRSEAVINKITISTATQVMLKVKIAEVTRTVAKSLGVSWRALTSDNGALLGMSAGTTKGLPEYGEGAGTLFKEDGLFGSDLLGGRWIVSSGVNSLTALIDATATEKLSTILAEPDLVALSGKSATFKSGGQKGFPTRGDNGSSNMQFKDWGTIVTFTPTVLSEDRINIKVSAEVSSVDMESSAEEPSLSSRNVETVVELGSGQSMVLAGLLQKNRTVTTEETPFLVNIPLIGSLFKSVSPNSDERELLVIITPYIIKPSSKKLKVPTDVIPKMLSPLKAITKRRLTSVNNKSVDSAGFSIK